MKIHSQQDLDKACETIDNFYGFFIAILSQKHTSSFAPAIAFIGLHPGYINIKNRGDYVIYVNQPRIRDITKYSHVIMRYL